MIIPETMPDDLGLDEFFKLNAEGTDGLDFDKPGDPSPTGDQETFSDEAQVAMIIAEEERRRCETLQNMLEKKQRKKKIIPKKKYKRGAITGSYADKYNRRHLTSLQNMLVLVECEDGMQHSSPNVARWAARPKPESFDYEIRKNWRDGTIKRKRKMVVDLITHNGTKRPRWGKNSHQPHWWPLGLPFADPNNGAKRAGVEDLNAIIAAAENALQGKEEDDDDDDESF
ncbi:Hypothetical predicted protein [Paramuricea clavata]|uniref:Uncharacterized protein n=1 Tax=Paramuricea clavata TaxID=317549 RepID=A0A7D9IE20_PARCT|nr:Hypothetical predicted protein [Paramuricea clavata]